MAKKKVMLKKGVGKFVRLTSPGRSLIIRDGDTVDDKVFEEMKAYLILYKAPPKPPKVIEKTSEEKTDKDSEE